MKRILITGAAGMIGHRLTSRLLEAGSIIKGCDSYTTYYDTSLKRARSADLVKRFKFETDEIDICNEDQFARYYESFKPDIVVNLAAQPGVRQGLEAPHLYVSSNIVGFTNVLDMCRRFPPQHLLYASSSSVYGANDIHPWSEEQATEMPVSLYAATKKANELMAHSYSHITKIPMTALRYFTVYGEWGRPDMAPYLFTSAVKNGKEITVFNNGKMSRDFTYVGDAVDATIALMSVIPDVKKAGHLGTSPAAPHRAVNIGSGNPINIDRFIAIVEDILGKKAKIKYAERAPGDVIDTYASTARLKALTGSVPTTSFEDGLRRLCTWLNEYEAK